MPDHGLERSSARERDAWADAGVSASPYNFMEKNMIDVGSKDKPGVKRVPSVGEREAVMGFKRCYTLGAVPSGMANDNPRKAFSVRASLVGNSISVPVAEWLLAQLAVHVGLMSRMPTRAELRDGSAKRLVAPEPEVLDGSGGTAERRYSLEEQMVVFLTSRCGSRGSDVRLSTGELAAPSNIRFKTMRPEWWSWKSRISTGWRRASHINVLETQAALLDLERRTRRLADLNTSFLVLLDTYVALGVLSKRRSSSKQIQRVLRRYDSLELASQCRPFFAYIRSSFNPADRPSRRGPAGRSARGPRKRARTE